MRRKVLGLGAVVGLAAVLLAAGFESAEARRGGGGGFRGGGHAHFGGFRHFGGGGFRRVAPYYVAPFVGYGAYRVYSGPGPCYWMKQRAVATGSRYWWRRYQACLAGY